MNVRVDPEFSNWTVASLRKYIAEHFHTTAKDLRDKLGTLKKAQWVGLATEIGREQAPLVQVNCIQGAPAQGAPGTMDPQPTVPVREVPARASPRPAPRASPRPAPRGNVPALPLLGRPVDLRTQLQQELKLKFQQGPPSLKKAPGSPPPSARRVANRPVAGPSKPPPPPPPLPTKKNK